MTEVDEFYVLMSGITYSSLSRSKYYKVWVISKVLKKLLLRKRLRQKVWLGANTFFLVVYLGILSSGGTVYINL